MPRFLVLTKRNAASGVPVFFHLALNLCKMSFKKLIKFDSLNVCLVVWVVNVYTKHVGTLFVNVTGSTCVSCTVWRQILYFNCKFCFGKCSFSAWVLQRISRDFKISSIYLRKLEISCIQDWICGGFYSDLLEIVKGALYCFLISSMQY